MMMAEEDRQTLYPLLFEPVLKDYIWGGRNLSRQLGRPLPADKDIAESWEIAGHANGDVKVTNGPLAGRTLSELTRAFSKALTGSRGAWALKRDKFPLLIKLLDASRKLSVQVHPDDDYAQVHEGNELGKTEMWVVLYAEDHAAIILGIKAGTTSEQFRAAIEAGTLEQYLHKIPVSAGDFVCVPSGSLHAILGGLLIAEIQQNSDVTYRVFDWNRVGHDGKPRPLHVDKALEVVNFEQVEPELPVARVLEDTEPFKRWELCRNRYFCVERLELASGAHYSGICDGSTLHVWGVIGGHATASGGSLDVHLEPVQFTLFPAEMGDYSVTTGDGLTTLLHAYLT